MSELFYGLAVLTCPLGTMMWLMTRGGKSHPDAPADSGAELARMRAGIDQLRAAQPCSQQQPGGGQPFASGLRT